MYKTFLPFLKNKTPELKDLALRHGIYTGAATDYNALTNNKVQTDLIERIYGGLVVEVSGNMGPQQTSQTVWDFSKVDFIYQFYKRRCTFMRGHVLVWYWPSLLPDWFMNGEFSQAQAIDILRDRITTNTERYPDVAWSVGNEFWFDDGSLVESRWGDFLGERYPRVVFEVARDLGLQHIEYNGWRWVNAPENNGEFQQALDLARDGLITHYGIQLHDIKRVTSIPALEKVLRAQIEQMASLGVKTNITEWDIRIPVDENKQSSQEDLIAQANQYAHFMKVFMDYKGIVEQIFWWATDDRHSWIDYFFPGWGNATLLDRNSQPKRAYYAIMEVLG